MTRPPRNIDEVKQNFGQLLDPDTDTGPRPTSDPEPVKSATRQLSETCSATAAEIRKTGDEVLVIANGLAAETQALAELLQKHGLSISNRIDQFVAMTKRIEGTLTAVRTDLSGATELPGPPLSPRS